MIIIDVKQARKLGRCDSYRISKVRNQAPYEFEFIHAFLELGGSAAFGPVFSLYTSDRIKSSATITRKQRFDVGNIINNVKRDTIMWHWCYGNEGGGNTYLQTSVNCANLSSTAPE